MEMATDDLDIKTSSVSAFSASPHSPRRRSADFTLQSHCTALHLKPTSPTLPSLSFTENEVKTVVQPTASFIPTSPTESQSAELSLQNTAVTIQGEDAIYLHSKTAELEVYLSSPSPVASSTSTQAMSATAADDSNDGEACTPPQTSSVPVSETDLVDRTAHVEMTSPPKYSAVSPSTALPPYVKEQHLSTHSLGETPWHPLEPPPPYFLHDQGPKYEKSASIPPHQSVPTTGTNNQPHNDRCYQYSVCIFACALLFFIVLPLIILATTNHED